jgi:hypothetical protein
MEHIGGDIMMRFHGVIMGIFLWETVLESHRIHGTHR